MDDGTLFLVIGVALAAYIAVVIAQAVAGIFVWWRNRSAEQAVESFEENINDGTIPRDYSRKMKAAMEAVNARQVAATESEGLIESESAIARFERLKSLRTTVALVRGDGYVRGECHRHKGIFNPSGCPHPKGSGAAQQWVRGYCAGANVMDIKQYIDEA